jgi:hypothetical protein
MNDLINAVNWYSSDKEYSIFYIKNGKIVKRRKKKDNLYYTAEDIIEFFGYYEEEIKQHYSKVEKQIIKNRA